MENTPDKGIYTPTNVELFNVHGPLRMREVQLTLQQMIGYAFTTILKMMSHPDRQTRAAIDPEHKHAFAVFVAIVDETSTPEEIEAGRADLLKQYDAFIEESRPKFSRISLPQPVGTNGGIVLQ